MKKFLLSALLVAAAAVTSTAAIIEVGYCNDPGFYPYDGIRLEENANIGVSIRLTARNMAPYRGGKIVGIKVGAAMDAYEHEVKAFVRKGKLSSEDVVSTTDLISWTPMAGGLGGWSNVLFDEEWTIPEDLKEDLYVGLFTSVEANKFMLGTSTYVQSVSKGQVYIAESYDLDVTEPTNWDDITVNPFIISNNVAITCLIDMPEESYSDVLMIDKLYAQNVNIADDKTTGYFWVHNDGLNEINHFEITVTCGDKSAHQGFQLESPMPAGYRSANRNPLKLPISVLGTGKHTVTISKVNGNDNTAGESSRTVDLDLIGVSAEEAAKHVRRPLIEFYCAEDDHLSGVYQDDNVSPGLAPFNGRYTYLPHHANDKFGMNPVDVPAYVGGEQKMLTFTDGDRLSIDLLGGINAHFIPAESIDRSLQMRYVELTGIALPMFGVLYSQGMWELLPYALNVPTFGSVELTNAYNADTRTLNIQASGSVADVLPEGEKAQLSLFIVEEGVESDSQEFPTSSVAERYPNGVFTHARVIRQYATPFYGDVIEPGDFVKTYTVDLESSRWNPDHMKVVAVLQRPETNDYMQRDVINTAEAPMTDSYQESFVFSSINDIEASKKGDMIFDLQGRRLAAPTKGINIINGKKILINK